MSGCSFSALRFGGAVEGPRRNSSRPATTAEAPIGLHGRRAKLSGSPADWGGECPERAVTGRYVGLSMVDECLAWGGLLGGPLSATGRVNLARRLTALIG